MTLDQFFEKLEQTPRDWVADAHAYGDHGPVGCIRRTDGTCPVNAVVGYQGWAGAGERGAEILTKHDLSAVLMASDDYNAESYRDIRERLLKACGLA